MWYYLHLIGYYTILSFNSLFCTIFTFLIVLYHSCYPALYSVLTVFFISLYFYIWYIFLYFVLCTTNFFTAFLLTCFALWNCDAGNLNFPRDQKSYYLSIYLSIYQASYLYQKCGILYFI